jgi:IclR family pca regulon transcriptional regulator
VRSGCDTSAVARDTIEYGAISLAIPVRSSEGRVIAAVNCTTTQQADEKSIATTRLKPLQEAARRIEAMLLRYPALAHSIAAS